MSVATCGRRGRLMSALLWALAACLAAGCGGTVELLRIDDPRLPIESRRWIADAEDAVLVTSAALERVQDEQRRVVVAAERTQRLAGALTKAGAHTAADRLRALGQDRVKMGRLHINRAEAALALAEAKQLQVNADMAIRHDLAVYDVDELRDAVDAARKVTHVIEGKIEEERHKLEERVTAWWQAYGSWYGIARRGEILWTD